MLEFIHIFLFIPVFLSLSLTAICEPGLTVEIKNKNFGIWAPTTHPSVSPANSIQDTPHIRKEKRHEKVHQIWVCCILLFIYLFFIHFMEQISIILLSF